MLVGERNPSVGSDGTLITLDVNESVQRVLLKPRWGSDILGEEWGRNRDLALRYRSCVSRRRQDGEQC